MSSYSDRRWPQKTVDDRALNRTSRRLRTELSFHAESPVRGNRIGGLGTMVARLVDWSVLTRQYSWSTPTRLPTTLATGSPSGPVKGARSTLARRGAHSPPRVACRSPSEPRLASIWIATPARRRPTCSSPTRSWTSSMFRLCSRVFFDGWLGEACAGFRSTTTARRSSCPSPPTTRCSCASTTAAWTSGFASAGPPATARRPPHVPPPRPRGGHPYRRGRLGLGRACAGARVGVDRPRGSVRWR